MWTFALVLFTAVCMPFILGLLVWEEIQRRHLKAELARRAEERRLLDHQRYQWGERLIQAMGGMNDRIDTASDTAQQAANNANVAASRGADSDREPHEPRGGAA